MRSFGREHVLRAVITTTVMITAAILTFISVHSYISHAAESSKVDLRNYVQEIHNILSEPTDSVLTDWPEFHGDVARDSYQPTNTTFNKVNATTLTTVSGPGFTTLGSIESSPAIYQGIVYAVAGTLVTSVTTTTDVSTMYAIDASSGQILWQSIVPPCINDTNQEWIASSPAVTRGMVNGNTTTEVFMRWAAGYPYDSSRGKAAQSVTPQRLEDTVHRRLWMRSTANTSPTSWLSVLSGVPNIARRFWLVRSPRSLPQ